MLVYSFRRSEGGACFLLKECEAENSRCVDVVPGMCVEGVVKWFYRPFVVTDAPVLVRFSCGYGTVSPTSSNQVKTKKR